MMKNSGRTVFGVRIGLEEGCKHQIVQTKLALGGGQHRHLLPCFQSLLPKCRVCFDKSQTWSARSDSLPANAKCAPSRYSLAGRRLFLSGCFGFVSCESMESVWPTPCGVSDIVGGFDRRSDARDRCKRTATMLRIFDGRQTILWAIEVEIWRLAASSRRGLAAFHDTRSVWEVQPVWCGW